MVLTEKNGIKYYTFKGFEQLPHCFTTRVGGVSQGSYSSLNMAFREDKRENILKNYELVCNAIGVKKENTFWTKQVHGDNIVVATEEDRGKGLLKPRDIEEGYDGVITNIKDIVLTGFSADCVLVFFYDAKRKVIGVTHSGWRGTVKKIVQKTVQKMQTVFGCDPKDIVCGISPSIGLDHFEVDEPVVTEFKNTFGDTVDSYILEKGNGKYHIDLNSIVEYTLLGCGIDLNNIDKATVCTMCYPQLFYSHRIMGNSRGSMAGLISLR